MPALIEYLRQHAARAGPLHGDVVSMKIEKIGTLTNPVAVK